MPAPSAIRLVVRPPDDDVFLEHVQAIMGRERPSTPSALRAHLRRTHPTADVRAMATGPGEETWEIRREAHGSLPAPRSWWQSPHAARLVSSLRGHAIDANPEMLALLGVTRDAFIGAHYSAFVPEEGVVGVQDLLAIVLRRRTGASRVTIRRSDGTPIPVEWHAERIGRRLEVWFRRI